METDDWIRIEVEIGAGAGGRETAGAGPEPGVEAGRASLRAAVSRILLTLGGSAVQERGRRLATYVRAKDAPADPAQALRSRLAELLGGDGWTVRVRRTRDRDWREAWKRGLGPRRVGRRWLVVPSWSRVDRGGDARILRIDPGAAFGTAEHGTTRGVLRLLETAVAPGDRVLDVGTGSGILSVAAVRLGASEVVALEEDPRAVETARRNVRGNGVEGRVRLIRAAATVDFLGLLVPPRYDVIVANLSTGLLVELMPGLVEALADGGHLLVGGVRAEERRAVLDAAAKLGFDPLTVDRDDGWWSARMERVGI